MNREGTHMSAEFLKRYFDGFERTLQDFLAQSDNKQKLTEAAELLRNSRKEDRMIYLVGNGGSAAVAEHMAVDLTKNAGLRALAISGTPMITTFANDHGYENVFASPLKSFARPGDILIAISSGGRSMNILNACKVATQRGMKVITFSGFSSDNPLKSSGDYNFWIDSKSYGYVELLHNLLIHYLNDAVIGEIEYSAVRSKPRLYSSNRSISAACHRNGVTTTEDPSEAEFLILGEDHLNLDAFPNVKAVYGVSIDRELCRDCETREITVFHGSPPSLGATVPVVRHASGEALDTEELIRSFTEDSNATEARYFSNAGRSIDVEDVLRCYTTLADESRDALK